MEGGWIRLHRKLREHWLWPSGQFPPKQYSKAEAFLDLILSANHRAGKADIGGRLIPVERGQLITSQKKLAARWGWNRETVSLFLRRLKRDGMLDLETSRGTGTGYSLITIANYSKYQDRQAGPGTGPDMEPSTETSTEPSGEPARNRHEQEEKNEKKLRSDAKRAFVRDHDPRVKEFLDWFSGEYEPILGKPYVVVHGKEGTLVKRLLATLSLEALKAAAGKYLRSDDPWIKERGHTIGILGSKINEFTPSTDNDSNGTQRKESNEPIW